MAELKLSGFVLDVIGLINLKLRRKLRGKMENQYYQRKELKYQSQSEISNPSAYKNEFSLKDKENIFKDVYSSIKLFDRIIYEASQKLKNENSVG